jgi:hypothetical protein
MGIVGICILIFILWLIFGRPSYGQRVYPDYGNGHYYGGGIGLLLVILLVAWLVFGGGSHHFSTY